MDLDQLIKDADPARGLEIEVPGPPLLVTSGRGARTGRLVSRVVLGLTALTTIAVAVLALGLRSHHGALSPAATPWDLRSGRESGSDRAESRGSLCATAKRLGYVPQHDACSDALTADVDGDGRPDLVLLYARPITGAGASLKAYPGTLKVVRASGATVEVRLAPQIPAPGIVAVGSVNTIPGGELFLYTSWYSSGPQVAVYSLQAGKLVNAGVSLNFGGDSANRFGFDCVQTPTPEIIQRDYSLIGPTIYGRWRLVTDTYAWSRATVRLVKHQTTIHHGWPHGSAIRPGPGCHPLTAYR
jgi:hypothetical protein